MGMCYKCMHDCTESSPCPCCRGLEKTARKKAPYYFEPTVTCGTEVDKNGE